MQMSEPVKVKQVSASYTADLQMEGIKIYGLSTINLSKCRYWRTDGSDVKGWVRVLLLKVVVVEFEASRLFSSARISFSPSPPAASCAPRT